MKFFILLGLMNINVLTFTAPKAVYDSYWDKSNESNSSTINNDDFNRFLSKYAKMDNGITKISYAKVSKNDKQSLKTYIDTLANIPILSYAKSEQQAYWINLYNALTIYVILETYPIKSIKESYGGAFKSGPWNKKLLTVEGREISLNDIEHRILRPIWKDTRVHFLVNCASLGCPNLLLSAITANTYEKIADQAAREFINHSRAITIEGNKLILTSLVDWYKEDFGSTIDNIIAYFMKYANPQTQEKLKQYKDKKILYQYDWGLNNIL